MGGGGGGPGSIGKVVWGDQGVLGAVVIIRGEKQGGSGLEILERQPLVLKALVMVYQGTVWSGYSPGLSLGA